MQVLKILTLLCLLLPLSAGAEGTSGLKAYLTKLRDKQIAPLDTIIVNSKGRETTLRAEANGRPVVLHFWATWCAPCITEMPALDKLAREMKGKEVFILALSEDFGGVEVVKKFYKKRGITALEPYADMMTGLANLLDVSMLPVTVLLDAEGKEVSRQIGVTRWEDEKVRAEIEALIPAKENPEAAALPEVAPLPALDAKDDTTKLLEKQPEIFDIPLEAPTSGTKE